ncbi:MAG: hypothetical protein OXH69_10055 [Acidobacteria bacterium]|nr:hypothetical protein [Acidobacteriota bacterium]
MKVAPTWLLKALTAAGVAPRMAERASEDVGELYVMAARSEVRGNITVLLLIAILGVLIGIGMEMWASGTP